MLFAKVIKYEGDNKTFVWKYPKEDFNTRSQLIVHQSQEAVFMQNGKILDMFGPGKHTLKTENLPVITGLMNLATGGRNSFHCELYFINKTEQMAIPWGTNSKIQYMDPVYQFPVEIGACGELSLILENAGKVLVKLVGTETMLDQDQLGEKLRVFVMKYSKSVIPQMIRSRKISVFDLDMFLPDFADAVKAPLSDEFIADQKQKMEEEQERHQKAIEKKAYWQKVKKKYMVPSIIAAVLVIAAAIIIPFWLYPEITVRRPAYEAGCAAMERGEYEEALQQFVVCGEDYRDTAELIRIIGFPKDGTTEMLEEAIPAYIEKVRSISLTDEHKKLMKTKAEELFTKLVIKNRRNEAEKYASELGDAFGDESDWTDLVEYSEITSERVNDKPKETLDKLSSMRERGAYEAEAHFSSGVAWYISEAEKDRSAYQSNNSVAHAERALLIYSEMGDNIPEAVTGKNEFIEQMGQDADSLASSKEYEKAASIYDLLGNMV